MKVHRFRSPTEVWMHVKNPGKLRSDRIRSGYTQVDLAALSRVTQQYISAMETGKDSDCSTEVAARISRYLGKDLEDLFEERSVVRMARVTTASRNGRSAA